MTKHVADQPGFTLRHTSVLVLLMLLMIAMPVVAPAENSDTVVLVDPLSPAYVGDGRLTGIPYVWQEMNGFCAWAATSMLMQYAGVPLGLHDLFAASTIGFSWAYIEYQENMLMFPGAIYQQAEPTDLAADLYGLNMTIYLSSEMTSVDEIKLIWEGRGINVGLLDDEGAAFDLMRATLDSGYPLLISVDPSWLPALDYDVLREQGLSGGGHGVVISGYNDTTGAAVILDPGVGSFGEDFGYPGDGRGNYNITYTALNSAWNARYYISITITPGGAPVEDVGAVLGPVIRDKLLGVGTAYDPDSASAIVWKYGEKGFRAMSETMTADGLYAYLSQFETMDNAEEFIAAGLVFIGFGMEAQVTLQYLSYRKALSSVQSLMPDYDLTDFVSAGEDALPHFDAISDNSSLILPGNITYRDSLVYGTFYNISASYNSTHDLEDALQQYATGLDEISGHLLGIADSWLAAGTELTVYWPNDLFIIYGPYLFLGGAAVAALVIGAIVLIRNRPSQ